MTQQELADKLFVSRSLVAKWEQGRGLPTADVVEKLAMLMNTSFEELMGGQEILTCPMEDNQTRKSKRRKTIRFAIFAGVLLLVIVGLIIGIYFFKENFDDDIQREPVYDTIETQTYVIATREEDKLVLENTVGEIRFLKEFNVHEPNEIIVKDKYNKGIDLCDIQSGYKLRVTFSYFQDTSSYEFPQKFNEISKIEVIEDYVSGQDYIQGFFLSTVVYSGEEVPINAPDLGFVSDRKEYDDFGNEIPLFQKYPYVLLRYYDTGKGFLKYTCEDVYTQAICNEVIRQKALVDARVFKDVETVYIYAIRNGNNGYYLHDTLHKERTSTQLTAKYVTDIYVNDQEKSHSTDVELKINLHFVSVPIEIREFNKDNVWIKTSPYGESFVIMLDDESRYIKLFYDDGCFSDIYTPGDRIFTVRVLPSGFVEDFYLTIL